MFEPVSPVSSDHSQGVLREVYDFGLGKMASVSACIGGNRYLVFSEPIEHSDPTLVDWPRMISELWAAGDMVEAQ